MRQLSAPLFPFGERDELATNDSHVREGLGGIAFALTGPGVTAEAGHLPVRGDLAHINLAGRYLVPHYAVPMPHAVTVAGATLRRTGREDGEALEDLALGTVFNVLDMAGGWAWGQVGEDGLVGYLPLAALSATGAA